jgi:hypothetical protein
MKKIFLSLAIIFMTLPPAFAQKAEKVDEPVEHELNQLEKQEKARENYEAELLKKQDLLEEPVERKMQEVLAAAVERSEDRDKRNRNISGVTGIDANYSFDIKVTKGTTESLTIEADDDIMPYVRSEVKNGVLMLYLDHKREYRNIKMLKAYVTVKELNLVKLSGACKLVSDNEFKATKFKISLSGASSLKLKINAETLSLNGSGASNIDLTANARTAKFGISGSTKLQLTLTSETTSLDISGASKISISGSTNRVECELSGASRIRASRFESVEANVEASGASNLEISVSKMLKVRSSGASSVKYKGRPSIDVSSSGSASVRSIN